MRKANIIKRIIRQGILSGNELEAALASEPEAIMDVPAIVREILDETELTQAQFAKKIGVAQSSVSKWVNDGHGPNTKQWDKVQKFASRYPKLQRLFKEVPQQSLVSVMGDIGTGAIIEPEFEQVPPEGLDQIELPFAVPSEIIAFRVKGDSMRPAYREGDLVLVWKDQRLPTDSFIGEEVAVRTVDGKRYLKEIQQGQRTGLYNLNSHNAGLISGVKVIWVGEIYVVVKAGQLRRLEKQQQLVG